MPQVIVDVSRLKRLHSGLGQWALHFARALTTLADTRFDFRFLLNPGDEQLLGVDRKTCEAARFWKKDVARRWLRPVSRWWPTHGTGDVWHAVDHLSTYSPADPRTPLILLIHDLNFLVQGSREKRRRKTANMQHRVNRASVITTVSEFSASQIRELIDLRGKPLRVIAPGLCLPPVASPVAVLGIQRPFLLSVAEFRRSKNLHLLVEMMQHLPEWDLVLAGNHASECGRDIARLLEQRGLTGRVHLPGIVSDEQRAWLYEKCAAYLFPSTAEGFGFPVIEAMSYGKPVFMARASSLPEVGGELGCYWHSLEPSAMAGQFKSDFQGLSKQSDLAARLRSHAAAYCWSRTAKSYIDLYQEVAQTHGRRAA